MVCHDVGARGESRYFAITDVWHAGEADPPADFGDCRQIERLVGRVAGPGRAGPRPPERIKRCERDLQWRQIGPMILAVTELEHPLWCYRGRDGRWIHTDGVG